mgnify:CR=1 FL=1
MFNNNEIFDALATSLIRTYAVMAIDKYKNTPLMKEFCDENNINHVSEISIYG